MKRSVAIVSLVLLCLSLSSAFAQTLSPTLTPQEREQALELFQTSRDNFRKSISGLSEKQWRFKLAPDRWSVAEVAEHIAVSDSTLFGLVQKSMQSPADPAKREMGKGKAQVIVAKVPDRSQKFKAPRSFSLLVDGPARPT